MEAMETVASVPKTHFCTATDVFMWISTAYKLTRMEIV